MLVLLQPGDSNVYTDEDGRFIFENILPGAYILKLDATTWPEDAIFTSALELKPEVPVVGEVRDMNFLIHVKPCRLIIWYIYPEISPSPSLWSRRG